MVLLSPANLILAASIAGPLLLLLYVLKLRRRPVRVGSALFWQSSLNDAQANEPFQRPRLSWLFLLHTLILALLALAIGRLAIADSRGAATRTIIILDVSASMSAKDSRTDSTRLATAKEQATSRIKLLLGEGFFARKRQVSLIASAQHPAIISPFSTSQALILDALNRQQGTDQPGDLEAAVSLARSLASSDDESSDEAPPSIEIYTDGGGLISASGTQSGASYPGVKFNFVATPLDQSSRSESQAPPSPTTPLVEGSTDSVLAATSTTPSNSTPSPTPPAPPAPPPETPEFTFPSPQEWNVGITLLNVQRDPLIPGALRVFVQITSNSTESRSIPLAVSLNGTVLSQRVVESQAAQSAPKPEPARSTTTIDLDSIGSGMLLVSLGVQDALTSDNQAGFWLDGVQQPTVLLVTTTKGSTSGISAAEWLLADALAELNIRGLERLTDEQYESQVASNGQVAAEVIVFDRYTPTTLPDVPTLSFGGLPPLPSVKLKKSGTLLNDSLPFFWRRNHPLLTNTTLDPVLIMEDSSFQIAPSTADLQVAVDEIVTSRNGPILVATTNRGVKHIATAFSLSSTNWPLQSSFPVFLAEAVSYLVNQPGNAAGRMFTTTQAAFVRGTPSEGELVVDGPISFTQALTDTTANGESQVSLGVLSQAGTYLVSGTGLIDRAVAVNLLQESESTLMIPSSSYAQRVAETSNVTFQSAPSIQAADRAIRLELWPILLAIASLLLLIEWFVYGSSLKP